MNKHSISRQRLSVLLDGEMRKHLLKHRLLLISLFELFCIVAGYYLSFLIRFDFNVPKDQIEIFIKTLPFLIFARMVGYYCFKIPFNSWLYASLTDLMDLVKANITGSAIFIVMMVFIYRLEGFPRSVFLLEIILNIMLIGGTKFSIRYIRENKRSKFFKRVKNVLIAGAGKAGTLTLNEIKSSPELGIQVVGFVDDNPQKKGLSIQGIPVRGSTDDIPDLVKKYDIDEVIVAIPSAPYKDIIRIRNIALSANAKTKVLPTYKKLLSGNFFSANLDVSSDDLLGRRVLAFKRESDYELLKHEIEGKSVLITGAGGSIGSELCKQVAQFGPKALIMYERHECSLYNIEVKMRKNFPDLKIVPVLGDILDKVKLDEIMRVNDVNIIYHAAAYKHVPMMEREPFEAIRNNVIGTRNTAELAIKNKVEKFVLISTDKAVNPANIMGTTKRVAELIVQFLNGKNGVKFIAVRFGNVLGSNGSVIPLFKKQIAQGGPITITHPDVTRYFMSVSEAVQLVMTSGAMGKGGEIFLLDMGEPIKIVDLAKELIKKTGLDPEKDIDIVYTGLRPGEKLYEELYWKGEGIVPTDNKKITMLRPNGKAGHQIFKYIDMLDDFTRKRDLHGVITSLKEMVPETTIS